MKKEDEGSLVPILKQMPDNVYVYFARMAGVKISKKLEAKYPIESSVQHKEDAVQLIADDLTLEEAEALMKQRINR